MTIFTKRFNQLNPAASVLKSWLLAIAHPSTGALKRGSLKFLGINGNVTQYGATGDGTTDDTQAIVDCLADNGIAYFPPGDYLITSTVALSDGQSLKGCGTKSRILCNHNDVSFTLAGNNLVEDLKFQTTASGGTSQIMLSCGAGLRSTIKGCVFQDCQGSALQWIGNAGALHDGGNVTNCQFDSCLIGCDSSAQGEYFTITASRFNTCGTAVQFAGGNNSLIGCDIENNTVGISLLSGTNDAHCVAIGCKINHNTTSISVNGVTFGYRFIGCMIYYGGISLTDSDRIQFESCDIAELTITGNNCTNTTITGGGAVSNVVSSLTSCPILGYEIGSNGLKVRDFGADTTTLIKPVLADFADNATAVGSGLAVGTLYRTGDAVKVVH